MPLFRCYIKQGKQSRVIIISANNEDRIKQLLREYFLEPKTRVEIALYTKKN